jgi:hypothetical protein
MSDAFESEIHFIMHQRAKTRLDSLPRREAAFIEPMECLSEATKLPEGSQWLWEIELEGREYPWRRLKPKFSQRSQSRRNEIGFHASQ